jgi:hypothetical protein
LYYNNWETYVREVKMKKILGIFILTIFIGISISPIISSIKDTEVYSEKTDISWEKIYGGNGNDAGDSVCQTTDGGFFIVGETSSKGAGNRDIWVLKTDSEGNIEWDKTFGGEYYDRGKHGIQTSDGGYILVGYTASFSSGLNDAWLIKLDSNGEIEWDEFYGGEGNEEGVCVQQTNDGGYVVAGLTNSYGAGRIDAWIFKTDFNGNIVWEKTFGQELSDLAEWIEQTNDGGYIFTGVHGIYSEGIANYNIYSDFWLVKIDENGDMVWEKFFHGGRYNLGHAVKQTQDEGYIITGWTNAGRLFGGDVWLIKTNSIGDTEWEKPIGKSYRIECAIGMDLTDDGGFILTGCSGFFTGWPARGMIAGVPLITKILVVKTDSSGNINWQETIGPGICMGRIVEQCNDGGYILIGNTGNHHIVEDLMLIKFNI